jgi:hypothetical protein
VRPANIWSLIKPGITGLLLLSNVEMRGAYEVDSKSHSYADMFTRYRITGTMAGLIVLLISLLLSGVTSQGVCRVSVLGLIGHSAYPVGAAVLAFCAGSYRSEDLARYSYRRQVIQIWIARIFLLLVVLLIAPAPPCVGAIRAGFGWPWA